MPVRAIELTAGQADLVGSLIESGHYDSAEEVIGESLDLLFNQDMADDATKLERLRAEIQIGLDDLEHGRYVQFGSADELRAYFAGRTDDIVAGRRQG